MNSSDAIDICLNSLKTGLRNELRYHTLGHTLMVLDTVELIADAEGLDENVREMLRLGAACHDCGFLITVEDHEEAGCRWIEPHLKRLSYTTSEIETIKGLIMATKLPQTPKNKLEQILCDADLAYIGTDEYGPIANTLFEELNALGKSVNERQWLDLQINFLENHVFFTDYARKTWNPGKANVLNELRQAKTKLPG